MPNPMVNPDEFPLPGVADASDQSKLKITGRMLSPKQTVTDLAYGGGWGTDDAYVDARLYRLERGYPFSRRGRIAVAVNQFKGLSLYSPTTSNLPQTKTVATPATSVGQIPEQADRGTPIRISFPFTPSEL